MRTDNRLLLSFCIQANQRNLRDLKTRKPPLSRASSRLRHPPQLRKVWMMLLQSTKRIQRRKTSSRALTLGLRQLREIRSSGSASSSLANFGQPRHPSAPLWMGLLRLQPTQHVVCARPRPKSGKCAKPSRKLKRQTFSNEVVWSTDHRCRRSQSAAIVSTPFASQ